MDNEQLVDCLFGGCPRRWSNAYKWFLNYLSERYESILNMPGLEREKDNFPRYAKAIARKINMVRRYVDPETGDEIICEHFALFDEDNFRIFSFLDGSYFKTNTAGSGPDGDYEGTMRKNNWYIIQRAIYNGYKRLHDLHILSLMLPTGMNYIFGPNPARGGDASAMMHSDLNGFLEELQDGLFVDQNGNQFFYATHGDLLFAPQSCISRNHKSAANAPLTIYQKVENESMNHA